MLFGVESSVVAVGAAAVSTAVVLDMTIWFFSWRSNRKRLKRLEFEMEEMRLEIRKLRDEINLLKHLQTTVKSTEANSIPKIQLNHLKSVAPSSQSSSSTSDYVDAVEDWSSGHFDDQNDDETPLLVTNNTSSETAAETFIQFEKIDELHEHNEGEKCYTTLKSAYDSDAAAKQNVQLLWRLARACHLQASSLQHKNPKKKDLLQEGQKYALAAYKIDNNNFNVLKWCAVLTGTLTDFLGTKEKIQQGYQFKEYLDKALAIQIEYSLLHMRGRFSYSVATLSWLERKAAAAFFAAPPTATIDDALKDFLEVERVRPNVWIENLLYVAKCYINKSDKANAAKYLKLAVAIEAQDDADSEALEEAKQLLAKYGK